MIMKNSISKKLLFSLLLLCSRCTKCDDPTNPECLNYNPCINVYRVSADFDIYEKAYESLLQKEYRTDTTIGSNVIFRAKESKAENYTWYIGSGTYSGREVELNFGSVKDSTSISVTLIVKKKPNLLCHPKDSEVLISTKKMFINRREFVYHGEWQGYYSDNPFELSIIEIGPVFTKEDINYQFYNGAVKFENLFPKIDSCEIDYGIQRSYRNYKPFKLELNNNQSPAYYAAGYIEVDDTRDNILINYEWTDKKFIHESKYKKLKFIGKRIK
jgi:hypothetical protein